MKTLVALVSAFLATAAFACPDNTTTLYEGEPVSGYCYTERPLYWGSVTEICLASEGGVLAYETAEDGTKRLVGVCNATFEVRY